MKCSNCGGALLYNGSVWLCQSCGNTISLDTAFENTEVFIAYIENDERGARTKDSIIANEIYRILESKNIHTFFERVSAENFAGDDLEKSRISAFSKAKVILFVGSSVDNFNYIYNKYSDYLGDKKIIPVYSSIKPELLPDGLKKLQALNFESVSLKNDLTVGVLNLLGRENEINVDELYAKSHKKTGVLISAAAIALVILVVVLFIVFKKDNPSADNEKIYNTAISLINEENILMPL
ncbi:MAG: hypothetical protein Q4B40_03670 [Clostridia bacterium]|nr:hypothetical protein [Clostridia bacterium]